MVEANVVVGDGFVPFEEGTSSYKVTPKEKTYQQMFRKRSGFSLILQVQLVLLELTTVIPTDVLVWGGFGIVSGLKMWGYRVIATIGKKITELMTPTRGFAAEFAAASSGFVCVEAGTTHLYNSYFGGCSNGGGRGLYSVRAETVRCAFLGSDNSRWCFVFFFVHMDLEPKLLSQKALIWP
ncbi:hypothetical protein ACLB2K_059644 [Fragaria x ananassa]